MSDQEDNDWESPSEDGDFSASEEDDWAPTKQDYVSSEESDSPHKDDNDTAEDDSDYKQPKTKRNRRESSETTKRASKKRIAQSLRNKLYNKYKPPPKTCPSISSSSKLDPSLSNILHNSKYSKKSSVGVPSRSQTESPADENYAESDSSGDNHLVDPNKVDLSSDFYNTKNCENRGKTPEFDCNIGCLSDSDDDDDLDEEEQDSNNKPTNKITNVNFNNLDKFTKNLEKAKETLKNYAYKPSDSPSKKNDVNALLAMGESVLPEALTSTSQRGTKKSSKYRRHKDDSDSDWEEVDEIANTPKPSGSGTNAGEHPHPGGIQVVVELPHHERVRRKQAIDLEMCLKRKMNRVKKEVQLDMHKTGLLCLIASMNKSNAVLNDPTLMGVILKLIPSQNCYPKDKTDIKYFDQIVKWYKSLIALKETTTYPKLSNSPPLNISLGLQIKSKMAVCKRDFVFIFVILARAIGLQCRIVLNFVTVPIRPSRNELCSLSTKPKEDGTKRSKNGKKKTPSTKSNINLPSTSKSSMKPDITKSIKTPTKEDIKKNELKRENNLVVPVKRTLRSNSGSKENKIPQVDGGDDLPKTTRTRTLRSRIIENPPLEQQKVSATGTIKTKSHNVASSSKITNQQNTSTSLKTKIENASMKASTSKASHIEESKSTRFEIQQTKIVKSKKPYPESDEDFRDPKSLKKSTSKLAKLHNVGKSDHDLPSTEDSTKCLIKKSTYKSPETVNNQKIARQLQLDISDDDFIPSPKKKLKSTPPLLLVKKASTSIERLKKIDRRVLSTDDEQDDDEIKKKKNGCDYWVEMYSEKSKRWITVDVCNSKVDCVEDVCRLATHPVSYVFAWNNDNTLKDVSARYCSQWNTVTRKMRVDKEWLNKAITQFFGKKTIRDRKEDEELNKIHLDKPLPTTVNEFKNHPLYALRRHLLKFEDIYPPDALILGYVRGEPVYARECVHTLHSREIWVKQARVVKPGEKPYKLVNPRPKWDRLTKSIVKDDKLLEIFGFWQTMEYEPPTAENGVVPRNAYGNVELFKECMLPKKTVHLRLNGLNRICKKLNVDCAPAVVGFDFHSGGCHATFDGYIICEEYKDLVVDAWHEDQVEQERKEREKYEKRVFGNWKKLIRGLLIREKLKIKYNYEDTVNKGVR